MSLRVDSRFSGGNVAAVHITEDESAAEVLFTANPCGGAEALWFDFKVIESAPDTPHPDNLTVTLGFIRNLTGCESPTALHPVYRGDGQGWNRARTGKIEFGADGQPRIAWTIPYPTPSTEFALCYSYGLGEVKTVVRKSKDYWSMGAIGLSQAGKFIQRVSNTVDRAESHAGIYIVARQHAGETPSSWVLDGMLQHFSRTNESRITVWAIPLADTDGIENGLYGRGASPNNLDQAWGTPPLRYETRAIQKDLAEWKTRCNPALVLDLQATGGSESEGIYCNLPSGDTQSTAARDSEKWANVLREALGDEYAAENFKRPLNEETGTTGLSLGAYAREQLSISALSIATPYALCGKTMMTPKQYREAGRRLARTIAQRVLGGKKK